MLIYDLGANSGEDTQAYLSAGHEVISVEANPRLANALALRFEREIREGQVTVIGRALGEKDWPCMFYISANDHWSSLDPAWAGREGNEVEAIKVQGITLADLFDEHGVPGYLKIDVEGADRTVLEQLLADERRPRWLSVEDCRFGPTYLDILHAAGYTGFKLSDQSILPPGTSGPFGDDLPGEWLSIEAMREHYAKTVRVGGVRIAPRPVYYDIHARLGG